MLKRRDPFAVSDHHVSSRLYKSPSSLDVGLAPVTQNYRLDQRGPAKVVDMIKLRATGDQAPDNPGVAKMRSCDKGNDAPLVSLNSPSHN